MSSKTSRNRTMRRLMERGDEWCEHQPKSSRMEDPEIDYLDYPENDLEFPNSDGHMSDTASDGGEEDLDKAFSEDPKAQLRHWIISSGVSTRKADKLLKILVNGFKCPLPTTYTSLIDAPFKIMAQYVRDGEEEDPLGPAPDGQRIVLQTLRRLEANQEALMKELKAVKVNVNYLHKKFKRDSAEPSLMCSFPLKNRAEWLKINLLLEEDDDAPRKTLLRTRTKNNSTTNECKEKILRYYFGKGKNCTLSLGNWTGQAGKLKLMDDPFILFIYDCWAGESFSLNDLKDILTRINKRDQNSANQMKRRHGNEIESMN